MYKGLQPKLYARARDVERLRSDSYFHILQYIIMSALSSSVEVDLRVIHFNRRLDD